MLALTLMIGCGTTREELLDLLEESRACAPGDTCVLAGSSTCTCASPVNARHLEEINDATESVNCGGIIVDCVAFQNPRCEEGVCVADWI
jgi:hypothetical protein